MDHASNDVERRFRALYHDAYFDLLRFAQRRVSVTHAEDVVGDVMLVAWRRLDDVPFDPDLAPPTQGSLQGSKSVTNVTGGQVVLLTREFGLTRSEQNPDT